MINCAYICSQSTASKYETGYFPGHCRPYAPGHFEFACTGGYDAQRYCGTFRQCRADHIKAHPDINRMRSTGTKKTGREIYYYFNPKKMKDIDIWLERFRSLWEDRFDLLDNLLKDF